MSTSAPRRVLSWTAEHANFAHAIDSGLDVGVPFVIAEIGVNHNGSSDLAHQLIDVAADTGADAVKFQTFVPEEIATDDAALAAYQVTDQGPASQQDLLRGLVLPDDVWSSLADHAHERGLWFSTTAFDLPSLRLVEALVDFVKVPSGEIDNDILLVELAGTGKPMILSTGASTLDEVVRAVDTVRSAGGSIFAVLHCVTAYPAPASDLHLRCIRTLVDELTDVDVGWSDHTVGLLAGPLAHAVGATVFERHLTLDRSMTGPDHSASSDPEEFSAYVASLREAAHMLGDRVKAPQPSETANRSIVRKGAYAARDLLAGTELSVDDLVFRRPQVGVRPSLHLIGARLSTDVAANAPIVERDLT